MGNNMKTYDDGKLQELTNQVTTIDKNASEVARIINENLGQLDNRIYKYYAVFENIQTTNKTLSDNLGDISTYGNWLNDTYSDYQYTKQKTISIAEDASKVATIGAALDNNLTKPTDGNKREEYKLNPDVIKNLPPNVQEVIKVKLKELGFTDEEIEKILNGEISVDKVALEELSSSLEKTMQANPELRDEITQIYGFDIFNEDGTINKDKLALAMIMDGKDPNDQYDLKALLAKYNKVPEQETPTTTPNPLVTPIPPTNETPSNNTPTNIIGNTIPKDNVIGNTPNIKVDEETTLEGIELTDKNALTLEGSNVATSIPKAGQILPNGETPIKKGSVGAITAGLGTAIAAAAGGIGIINKKDKNKDGTEEKDDENIQLLNEEKIIDPESEPEEEKDWLYGLGIGLTDAFGISDEDDENEEY